MLARINCKVCRSEMVVHAGVPHDGICRVCRELTSDDRDAKYRFYVSVDTGDVYRVTDAEIAQATIPQSLSEVRSWSVEPTWYSEKIDSIELLLTKAERDDDEYATCAIFRSDLGSVLSVVSNAKYAVCRLQECENATNFYAYTRQNLSVQVPAADHLYGTCPCCGINQEGHFPSRFHAPKSIGYQIAQSILLGRDHRIAVSWLKAEDQRWTDSGLG